jgi:hypothetical protein
MSALERLRLALPDVAEAITGAVREELARQAGSSSQPRRPAVAPG